MAWGNLTQLITSHYFLPASRSGMASSADFDLKEIPQHRKFCFFVSRQLLAIVRFENKVRLSNFLARNFLPFRLSNPSSNVTGASCTKNGGPAWLRGFDRAGEAVQGSILTISEIFSFSMLQRFIDGIG